MNRQKVKIEQMRIVGNGFWQMMKTAAYALEHNRSLDLIDSKPGALRPLGSLLRSAIMNTPYDRECIKTVESYLNLPVTADTGKGVLRFSSTNPLRKVSESFLHFISYFQEDSSLRRYSPIIVCPRCDALFLRSHGRQKACSNKCRFEHWRETSPYGRNYWKADKPLAKKRKKQGPKR